MIMPERGDYPERRRFEFRSKVDKIIKNFKIAHGREVPKPEESEKTRRIKMSRHFPEPYFPERERKGKERTKNSARHQIEGKNNWAEIENEIGSLYELLRSIDTSAEFSEEEKEEAREIAKRWYDDYKKEILGLP